MNDKVRAFQAIKNIDEIQKVAYNKAIGDVLILIDIEKRYMKIELLRAKDLDFICNKIKMLVK